jgi:hypothetical protein
VHPSASAALFEKTLGFLRPFDDSLESLTYYLAFRTFERFLKLLRITVQLLEAAADLLQQGHDVERGRREAVDCVLDPAADPLLGIVGDDRPRRISFKTLVILPWWGREVGVRQPLLSLALPVDLLALDILAFCRSRLASYSSKSLPWI